MNRKIFILSILLTSPLSYDKSIRCSIENIEVYDKTCPAAMIAAWESHIRDLEWEVNGHIWKVHQSDDYINQEIIDNDDPNESINRIE